MSKIFKVYYADKPAGVWDEHGTSKTSPNEMLFTENFLSWELNEDPLTVRWLDMVTAMEPEDVFGYSWNFYNNSIQSVETLFSCLEELNSSIDTINRDGLFECDPKYKLDIDAIRASNDLTIFSETELFKLNQIHFIFENVMLKTSVNSTMYKFLERLNSLVHTAEKYFVFRDLSKIKFHMKQSYLSVIRIDKLPESPKLEKFDLTDDDYIKFKYYHEINGSLVLDFATVGKDLTHAMNTDDVDLIKNQEVKHQLWAKPYVSYTINDKTFGHTEPIYHDDMVERVEAWAIKNNISEYGYDYTEPKYTPGRHKLGHPQFDFEQGRELILAYPYIVNVSIEDNAGNTLWTLANQ